MNIDKKYKLEGITSKDKTREALNSIYVYENGRTWAVATNGRALAKVPVEIKAGELEKGNSIKANDLKFQRSNPAIKKQDNMFCFLEKLPSQYPNIDMVIPTGEAKVSFKLDVALLKALADALGTENIKIEYIDENKPLRVSVLNGEANGVIMHN